MFFCCCLLKLARFRSFSPFLALYCFATKMLHFFELVFLSIVACTTAGHGKHNESFDSGNYFVEWTYLPGTQEIQFNITVKAGGWVGLGISKDNFTMKRLDVVVGGFNSTGHHYIWDMYVDATMRPANDPQQDAKFVSGSEKNGMTNLVFKRKLDTGDARKDNAIKVDEPYYLAWAFHNTIDATDPLTFAFHEKKGYSGAVTLASGGASGGTVAPTSSSSNDTDSTTTVKPTVTTVKPTVTTASVFCPVVVVIAVGAAVVHVLNYM